MRLPAPSCGPIFGHEPTNREIAVRKIAFGNTLQILDANRLHQLKLSHEASPIPHRHRLGETTQNLARRFMVEGEISTGLGERPGHFVFVGRCLHKFGNLGPDRILDLPVAAPRGDCSEDLEQPRIVEFHREGVDAEATIGFDQSLIQARGDAVTKDLGQDRQRWKISVQALWNVPAECDIPELARTVDVKASLSALLRFPNRHFGRRSWRLFDSSKSGLYVVERGPMIDIADHYHSSVVGVIEGVVEAPQNLAGSTSLRQPMVG